MSSVNYTFGMPEPFLPHAVDQILLIFWDEAPQTYLKNNGTSDTYLPGRIVSLPLWVPLCSVHNSLRGTETKILHFGVYRCDLSLTLTFAHQNESPTKAITLFYLSLQLQAKYLVFIRYLISVYLNE